jgi:hypothetical protein
MPSRAEWLNNKTDPLAHRAARAGDLQTTFFLIEQGANPLALDGSQESLWGSLLRCGNFTDRGLSDLALAALRGGLPTLNGFGHPIAAINGPLLCTLIRRACLIPAAELLKAGHADKLTRQMRNELAHLAIFSDNEDGVFHRLAGFADDLRVFLTTLRDTLGVAALDAPSATGRPALLSCGFHGRLEAAGILIDLGADLDAVDALGHGFRGAVEAGRERAALFASSISCREQGREWLTALADAESFWQARRDAKALAQVVREAAQAPGIDVVAADGRLASTLGDNGAAKDAAALGETNCEASRRASPRL